MRRFFSFLLLSALSLSASADELKLDQIKLPPGFRIHVYADNLPGARSMAMSPNGVLFVGTRHEGNVYAVVDENQDQKADKVVKILKNLNTPNGVAFLGNSLYVAEVNRVLRYDRIDQRLKFPPKPVVVRDDFPKDRAHGWKYIRFGPDKKLYVPVGAPCNICDPENPIYSSITRMDAEGKEMEIFARGIRNSVGFDWHPDTQVLWFTDNGRDEMGDNRPPDELNIAPKAGMHFGFPYCHGNVIADPDYGKGKNCRDYTPAALELGPHVAALAMRFYTGTLFPAEYRGQIFIAEHGSWNRTMPIGYRITLVRLKNGKPVSYETFAEGWLTKEGVWGRPVDIHVMPDGALLVSDDKAGVIYRITTTR